MVFWTLELRDSVKPSNVKNVRKENIRNCPGTQLIPQTCTDFSRIYAWVGDAGWALSGMRASAAQTWLQHKPAAHCPTRGEQGTETGGEGRKAPRLLLAGNVRVLAETNSRKKRNPSPSSACCPFTYITRYHFFSPPQRNICKCVSRVYLCCPFLIPSQCRRSA